MFGKNPKFINDFEFKLLNLAYVERSVTIDVLFTSLETSKIYLF